MAPSRNLRREGLELRYETVSTVDDPQAQPRELLPLLLEHQEKHRKNSTVFKMPASSPAVFSRTPLDHSWRPRPRKSLASSGSAFVKGEVSSRSRDFTLEARLFRGRGRQLWSNGVRLKTAGEPRPSWMMSLASPPVSTAPANLRRSWSLMKSVCILISCESRRYILGQLSKD